ncbi:MAG: hypothetical protein IJF63_04850 [Alistipes sp.]|nr:hypothetical protein [Alistipes sp.]MBQ6862249.1 hypothetical protein [Alistipes sp.]
MMRLDGGTTYTSINNFQSKADALHYAIEFTATTACDGGRKANYEAAQELYDFICKNVQLPEVTPNPLEAFSEYLKKNLPEVNNDSSKKPC